MKVMRLLIVLMFVPLLGWAQGYRNLDEALAGLSRGFEAGSADAIVAGLSEGEKVMLSFPGLMDQSGFFGRDQASYLIENLFTKVKPVRFQQVNTRKNTAEKQYLITARWTIEQGGTRGERDLYITLRNQEDRWTIASIRSGS
jgi:hypothetical protein